MERLADILVNWNLKEFSFERPELLWLLLPALLFSLLEYFPKRKANDNEYILKQFIDAHLLPFLMKPANIKGNLRKSVYFSIVFALLVIAVANPRYGFTLEEANKTDVNIVILLDISKSMSITDEKPNRLERAKQEVTDLIDALPTVNFALVAFADNPHLISPFTDDINAFKYLMSGLDNNIMRERGSRIDKGIKYTGAMFANHKTGSNYIIVISDGGFEVKQSYSEIKSNLNKIDVIGLGVGTDAGGPIPDDNGSYIKDYTNQLVVSKFDKNEFLNLVDSNKLVRASYLDDDTKQIIKIIKGGNFAATKTAKLERVWSDKFFIPLALAMLMLLFKFKRGLLFPLLVLGLFSSPMSYAQSAGSVPVVEEKVEGKRSGLEKIKYEFTQLWEEAGIKKYFQSPDQQAAENLEKGNYNEALQYFKSDYNKAVTKYRSGDLKAAREQFEKINTDADAIYNEGNSQIFSNDVEGAIRSYENALKLSPHHVKAEHNLEIAKKILQKKKEDMEKEKQQQQQKDKKQGGKNNKNNKDNKNQDQQNKDDSQSQQSEKNNQQDKDQQNSSGKGKEDKPQDGKQQDGKDKDNDKSDKDQEGKNQSSNDGKKPEEDKKPSDNSKQPDKKNEEKNGNQQQQNNNEGSKDKISGMGDGTGADTKPNKGSQKNSLDLNAEELMNRLKNDPSELMYRRFKGNKTEDEENDIINGGNRPW